MNTVIHINERHHQRFLRLLIHPNTITSRTAKTLVCNDSLVQLPEMFLSKDDDKQKFIQLM